MAIPCPVLPEDSIRGKRTMKTHIDFPNHAIKKASDSSVGESSSADDFAFLRDF